MSFGVGITMMKLTNKRSSRAGARHTGTLGGVVFEALEERQGSDPDIDRGRTALNSYQGIRRAVELVTTMNAEADAYSERRKKAGGRALRDTAAIGFATIVKPDADFIMGLSEAERERFFRDSNEILDGILGADNVRSRVRHRDEAADHEHTFRMGFTPSGKLETAYYFKPQLWRRINVEFPQAMRQRGWDVADCDVYDPDKADDPAYMAEREAKRKRYGRGSAAYKDAQAKKKRAEADRMKIDAAIELADARAVKAQAERDAAAIRDAAAQELQKARRARQEAQEAAAAAKADREALDAARARVGALVASWTPSGLDAGFLAMPVGKIGRTVGDYVGQWAGVYRRRLSKEAERVATPEPTPKPRRILTGAKAARDQERQRDAQALVDGMNGSQEQPDLDLYKRG